MHAAMYVDTVLTTRDVITSTGAVSEDVHLATPETSVIYVRCTLDLNDLIQIKQILDLSQLP